MRAKQYTKRPAYLRLNSIRSLMLVGLMASSLLLNASTPEKAYQANWCDGQTEYRLLDATRVDCLTDKRAIEFDFDSKWAESMTQALHYARITNKRAAVVLIERSNSYMKHFHQLKRVIDYSNLAVDLCLISKTGRYLLGTARSGWCVHRTLEPKQRANCVSCHQEIGTKIAIP